MYRLFPIILILCVSVGAAGAEPPRLRLTPEKAVSEALAHNRDLTAARFALSQAEGRLRQTGLWPNPELKLSGGTDGLFNDEREYTFTAGLEQRFPVSGRLARAKAIAQVDIALAMAEIRDRERLLIGEVLGRSRELFVLKEQVDANQEIQGTLRRFVELSQKRFEAAEVSSVDVNLARMELQKVDLAHARLLTRQESAIVALNHLLGREPDTELQIIGTINTEIDLDSLAHDTRRAVSRRPDRQQAALALDRAAAEIKLARALRWEDWTIGFEYDRDAQSFDDPIGKKRDDLLGLSLSVPLPLWNRNEGLISEAHATQNRARANLVALELRIAAEARSAANKIRRMLSIVTQYRAESLKLSEKNVDLVQQGYANGLIDITLVIQAHQQYAELRQSYWEAVGELIAAQIEWQTATASNRYLQQNNSQRTHHGSE